MSFDAEFDAAVARTGNTVICSLNFDPDQMWQALQRQIGAGKRILAIPPQLRVARDAMPYDAVLVCSCETQPVDVLEWARETSAAARIFLVGPDAEFDYEGFFSAYADRVVVV